MFRTPVYSLQSTRRFAGAAARKNASPEVKRFRVISLSNCGFQNDVGCAKVRIMHHCLLRLHWGRIVRKAHPTLILNPLQDCAHREDAMLNRLVKIKSPTAGGLSG